MPTCLFGQVTTFACIYTALPLLLLSSNNLTPPLVPPTPHQDRLLMDEPRRSARVNKGVHSGRDFLELYYEGNKMSKKPRIDGAEEDPSEIFEVAESSETVRCTPCGTTDANYNEETDNGGLMIECEKCTTWQHAKCMGYASEKKIPERYMCNICTSAANASAKAPAPKSKSATGSTGSTTLAGSAPDSFYLAPTGQIQPNPISVAESKRATILAAIQKTRDSVSKALSNVIAKSDPQLSETTSWAGKIEAALFEWAHGTDKKYIDKSRAVMALVKKTVVLHRLVSGEISAKDLTVLPVEDIDPDLKHYAEKVRQELIRRSVLVVEDEQSQRVRRTHKGEEIVESVQDEGVEQNVSVAAGSAVRDNTTEPQQSSRSSLYSTHAANGYHYEDDDDYVAAKDDLETQDSSEKKSEATGGSDSDDDMDVILERSKSPEIKAPKPPKAPKIKVPPILPTEVWTGDIELPDVASAAVQAEFVSCTNYKKPRDVSTANFHNKAIRICKEIYQVPKLLIQGRLDRTRADAYVAKIRTSRDLFLVKLNDHKADAKFSKLYEYFAKRTKVGVVSCKAACVKDAYMYAIQGDVPDFMDFAPGVGDGLYLVYLVKKDYAPVGKSILKKLVAAPPKPVPAPSLNSILSKLGGSMPPPNTSQPSQRQPHLPPKPAFVGRIPEESQPQSSPPYFLHSNQQYPNSHPQSFPSQSLHNGPTSGSGLTQDQLSFLTELVKLNGQPSTHQPSNGAQSLLNIFQNNSN